MKENRRTVRRWHAVVLDERKSDLLEIQTGTVDILTISASQCGSGEIESAVDEILTGRGPR